MRPIAILLAALALSACAANPAPPVSTQVPAGADTCSPKNLPTAEPQRAQWLQKCVTNHPGGVGPF